MCTKVTELPPFGGQQLFYNKVDKASEVTNDSLFVEPDLQGHLVSTSVIDTGGELADELELTTRLWEIEDDGQILDVQGRLK